MLAPNSVSNEEKIDKLLVGECIFEASEELKIQPFFFSHECIATLTLRVPNLHIIEFIYISSTLLFLLCQEKKIKITFLKL